MRFRKRMNPFLKRRIEKRTSVFNKELVQAVLLQVDGPTLLTLPYLRR